MTELTVTEKLSESDSSPSVAVTVKNSLPLKSGGAVNIILVPLNSVIISTPSVIVYERTSSSISVAENETVIEVSSSNDISCESNTRSGASLIALMVTVTLAVSVKSPSLTVNTKESSPL